MTVARTKPRVNIPVGEVALRHADEGQYIDKMLRTRNEVGCTALRVLGLCVFLARTLCAHGEGDETALQALIDGSPGEFIAVPPGEYVIDEPLRISANGTRLTGHGTIIQRNPAAPIILIESVYDVLVRDLKLTRPADAQEVANSAILIMNAKDVAIDSVRITGNKARDATIQIRTSSHVAIRNCTIRDYKRVAVDDRTDSDLYGYAFQCIDGTGILADRSTHCTIESNRIIEESLVPTRQEMETLGLGKLVPGRNPDAAPGPLGKNVVAKGFATNWHQGSAIVVTGPEDSEFNTVRGNHIVNAAQGIDLHCDRTIVSENVIDHCFVGLKATHGCHGLVLSGNVISHVDLWGILLNPGAASHAGSEDKAPNVDAAITISNNIITYYGYGHEFWNWGGREADRPGSYAIALFDGQLAENPPLRDVTLTGNIVYDPGHETGEPPRYRYAVFVGSWHGQPEDSPNLPQGLSFSNNRFHPGTMGVANTPLQQLTND